VKIPSNYQPVSTSRVVQDFWTMRKSVAQAVLTVRNLKMGMKPVDSLISQSHLGDI
jgi:hypothetical protein